MCRFAFLSAEDCTVYSECNGCRRRVGHCESQRNARVGHALGAGLAIIHLRIHCRCVDRRVRPADRGAGPIARLDGPVAGWGVDWPEHVQRSAQLRIVGLGRQSRSALYHLSGWAAARHRLVHAVSENLRGVRFADGFHSAGTGRWGLGKGQRASARSNSLVATIRSASNSFAENGSPNAWSIIGVASGR